VHDKDAYAMIKIKFTEFYKGRRKSGACNIRSIVVLVVCSDATIDFTFDHYIIYRKE